MRHAKLIALNSAFLLSFLLGSCSSFSLEEKTYYAFSTLMNFSLYNVSEEVISEVDSIIRDYDALTDNYKSHSGYFNIYDLNHSERNQYHKVDSKLYEILDYSYKIMDFCGDFFDIRLGKVSEIYKETITNHTAPDIELVQTYLAEGRETTISFNQEESSVMISGSGDLDLGAIAKGYALEKVKECLASNGVTHYLLNGGTSSYILGEKPNDEEGYTVQISNIDSTIYKYKNVSIGTSSYSEQYYQDGDNLYTHIINPKTGSSAPLYYLVSVIGSDCAQEDAFSTAFINMDLASIEEYAKTYNLTVYISENGSQIDHKIG